MAEQRQRCPFASQQGTGRAQQGRCRAGEVKQQRAGSAPLYARPAERQRRAAAAVFTTIDTPLPSFPPPPPFILPRSSFVILPHRLRSRFIDHELCVIIRHIIMPASQKDTCRMDAFAAFFILPIPLLTARHIHAPEETWLSMAQRVCSRPPCRPPATPVLLQQLCPSRPRPPALLLPPANIFTLEQDGEAGRRSRSWRRRGRFQQRVLRAACARSSAAVAATPARCGR
jgi:hypothetical protein